MLIHQPTNKFKITELFAFVSEDEGGEGVLGAPLGGFQCMPLVGADMERVQSLIPIAKSISQSSGVKVKLLKFRLEKEIEI